MNSGHRMVERQDNTVERRMPREGDLILSLLRSSDYGDMGGLVARKLAILLEDTGAHTHARPQILL